MVDKRRYLFLWMIICVGVFIIIAGLLLALLDKKPAPAASPTPATAEQVKRITVQEAKTALDGGTAVFVDVRDSAAFERSHIRGALSIPSSDLTSHLDELDPASWIITYCT